MLSKDLPRSLGDIRSRYLVQKVAVLIIVCSNSYQPGGTSAVNKKTDPLSDRDECLRDAALMQRLGVSDHTPLD